MNTPRLNHLADFLDALPPERFDMNTFFGRGLHYHEPAGALLTDHECGTTACIAGWAIVKWAPDHPHDGACFTLAKDLLDLTERQADNLFYPYVASPVSNSRAAQALRNLAETGEVAW